MTGAAGARLRFDGWIAGFGTASGTRIVVGHWPRSPFGGFSDVMVEDVSGHRTLLAADPAASFIAETYRFDEVLSCPVAVAVGQPWRISAGPLAASFAVGRRSVLGWLLHAVPERLAAAPQWVRLVDLPARLLPGVRATGSASAGRREWYGVRDLHLVAGARAAWSGRDLGRLAYVRPPVRFGFGSVPARPSLVRVTTTIRSD